METRVENKTGGKQNVFSMLAKAVAEASSAVIITRSDVMEVYEELIRSGYPREFIIYGVFDDTNDFKRFVREIEYEVARRFRQAVRRITSKSVEECNYLQIISILTAVKALTGARIPLFVLLDDVPNETDTEIDTLLRKLQHLGVDPYVIIETKNKLDIENLKKLGGIAHYSVVEYDV